MSCLPSQIAESNPTKMRISSIKLQGRMVVPRMVATSEKNVQLALLSDQARQLKSYGLKILKTYKLCWRTLWTSLPTSTSLVFARLSSVFPNELVLVSLVPCHSLNQGCKRFLKRFHASCQQNKMLFDAVSTGFYVHILSSTCWLFIKKSLMRSEFWQLQSQWNWT